MAGAGEDVGVEFAELEVDEQVPGRLLAVFSTTVWRLSLYLGEGVYAR